MPIKHPTTVFAKNIIQHKSRKHAAKQPQVSCQNAFAMRRDIHAAPFAKFGMGNIHRADREDRHEHDVEEFAFYPMRLMAGNLAIKTCAESNKHMIRLSCTKILIFKLKKKPVKVNLETYDQGGNVFSESIEGRSEGFNIYPPIIFL
jgi:hypothetical protein